MLKKDTLTNIVTSNDNHTHLFYPTGLSYDRIGYDKDQTTYPNSYLKPNNIDGIEVKNFYFAPARRAWHLLNDNNTAIPFFPYWLSIPSKKISLGKMSYNTDDEFYWAFPNREVGFVPNIEHEIAFTLERPEFDNTYIETGIYWRPGNMEVDVECEMMFVQKPFDTPFLHYTINYRDKYFTLELNSTFFKPIDYENLDNIYLWFFGLDPDVSQSISNLFYFCLQPSEDGIDFSVIIEEFENMFKGGFEDRISTTFTLPPEVYDVVREWITRQVEIRDMIQHINQPYYLDPFFNNTY